MGSLLHDVRYALRAFRRSPGFVVVAVLVLALGIGANTAIFSLVNAVLFRPLPVPGAGDLRYIHVGLTRSPGSLGPVDYGTFRYLAEHNDAFTGVAQFTDDWARIGANLEPQRVHGERVSTNYFDVLQVPAALGRTLLAADDLPGATPAIVISDRFWRERLDRNPKVIGAPVDLRGGAWPGYYAKHHRVYTIVGVMPPGFSGISSVWEPAEFWAPIRQRATDGLAVEREFFGSRWTVEVLMRTAVVGRLKPGVTDRQAMPSVLAAERDMLENSRAGERRKEPTLMYGKASSGHLPFDTSGKVVPARMALALMLVSTMVLLIAAANLAGLLMARGVSRRGEIGVRLALGAGRTRVARQVLTESVLLSLAGAVAGLGVAEASVSLFLAYLPSRLGGGPSALRAITLDVPMDVRVLLFTAALGVAAGVLVGLMPALQALKTDLLAALAGGSAAAPMTARSWMRRWIIIPQIGLSLVLLLVAGVLVRTLVRAELADRGFKPDGVLRVDFALPLPPFLQMTPDERRANAERLNLVYARLIEQVSATPVVRSAALTQQTPWDGQFRTSVVNRFQYFQGQNHWVSGGLVSAGYFETMGIPIVRGRAFDARDSAATVPVAIVCERLARVLWPGKDAIGQFVANHDPRSGTAPKWLLVVGVAGEVKVAGQEDHATLFFYMPLEQQSPSSWTYASSIVVRGLGNPQAVRRAVTAAILAAHPEVEIRATRTLAEDIGEVLYPRRLAAAILALSGLVGLLLSGVGLYGMVSYSAAQRLREIGIRAALGAEKHDIVLLMLRDALLALGIGVACGVALGFAGVRVVSSLLVALPTLDVLTLVTVPALLCAVILAACLLPARRAARVNLIEVLRGL